MKALLHRFVPVFLTETATAAAFLFVLAIVTEPLWQSVLSSSGDALMRGRRPKPTALKIRDGNPGGRPLNLNEPKPRRSIPTCPAHLSPTAKAEWKRLAHELDALGILSNLDRAALAAYCQAYGRWVEAERKLKETPTLLKTPSGHVQPSPYLAIANRQLELMHKFMSELGLSPSSRSRVAASPRLGPKPWEDWGQYDEPEDEPETTGARVQ